MCGKHCSMYKILIGKDLLDRFELLIDFKHLKMLKTSCVPVDQWLEHCVSSAKVVGSIPREHMYFM